MSSSFYLSTYGFAIRSVRMNDYRERMALDTGGATMIQLVAMTKPIVILPF